MGAASEAGKACNHVQQSAAELAGEGEVVEQVENFAAFERCAFDLQDTHGGFDVAQLIETQTQYGAGFGILRTMDFAQIGNGFATIGEVEFESGAVGVGSQVHDQSTAGVGTGVAGNQFLEFGEL